MNAFMICDKNKQKNPIIYILTLMTNWEEIVRIKSY